jgi:hypothetical protein
MGAVLACCPCPWHRVSANYQPLCEEHELKLGADEARIQAIADEDQALLNDPAIKAVIDGSASDDPMNGAELDDYVRNLGA